MGSRFKDLTGKRFGKLVVLYRTENKVSKNGKSQYAQWVCQCDCGNKKICTTGDLNIAGNNASCGCFTKKLRSKNAKKTHTIHGGTNTRLFSIWSCMKERCSNPNKFGYDRYGGRGISVCNEWTNNDGFINFRKWAQNNGYKNNLSIDRIDNNGDYCPENCRWATNKEQQRNTKNNTIIKYNGEEKCVAEWAEQFNLNPSLISYRYAHNYPIEKLFDPPRKWKSPKQSGIKGVIYNKKQNVWIVKGFKDNKKDKYVASFKKLDDAKKYKKEYDKNNPYPE